MRRIALLLALVVACTSAGEAASCDEAGARAALDRIVADYNDGDIAAVDESIAGEPAFQWYSEHPYRLDGAGTPNGDPRDRSTLAAYLGQRHAAGDRLRLTDFGFNGVSSGMAHFAVEVDRPEGTTPGKGAFVCSTMQLAVWSTGPSAAAESD